MAELPQDLSLFDRIRTTRPRFAEKTDRKRAGDGEWARCSGHWAAEKLSLLEHYMAIFTAGMHRLWQDRLAYVDLMAGPGICVMPTGVEFLGSPLRALQTRSAFRTAVFVERDPVLAEALRRRSRQSQYRPVPAIIQDDCNSAAAIAEIGVVRKAALCWRSLTFWDST